MLSRLCLCALLLGLVMAQATLINQRVYSNCATTPDGTPCVELTQVADEPLQAQALSCAVSADGAKLLVVDTEGLELLKASDLTSIDGTYSRTYCEFYQTLPLEVSGNFIVYQQSVGNRDLTNIGSCTCETAGDCRQRHIQFKSLDSGGFGTLDSVLAVGAQEFSMTIYDVESDVIDAPLPPYRCDVPRPYPWENNTDPNSVLAIIPSPIGKCLTEFMQTQYSDAKLQGFQFMMLGDSVAGAYSPQRDALAASGMTGFYVDGSTWPQVQTDLMAGYNVTVSFGPSFVGASSIDADLPIGLGTVDVATGAVTRNPSIFKSALRLIQESAIGGRENIVWVVGPDSDFSRVIELDVTAPASPVVLRDIQSEINFTRLDYATCPRWYTFNNPWYGLASGVWDASGTSEFFSLCPAPDFATYPFSYALFLASRSVWRATYFFQEASMTYAILAYAETTACVACVGTRETQAAVTLWRVSDSTPSLVDQIALPPRIGFDVSTPFEDTVISLGLVFYTDALASGAVTFWRSVDGSGIGRSVMSYNDTALPSDVVVTRRQVLSNGRMLVNFLQYGSVIYDYDGSGILGVNTRIQSFEDPSAEPANSGVQQVICGDGNPVFYRINNLGSTGSPGLYESSTLEAWSTENIGTTSSSTTSSGAGMSSTTTSSASSTSGAASPSASRNPSSTIAPACVTPDVCKLDCSPPQPPTKLPKPSVDPSKLPATSKEAKQSVFTVELTFESTAEDCGSTSPSCCNVRDWFGDDAVAAAFRLCNSDSTTKNRAPSYDSKAGTCTIFLAAYEGTDTGKITKAEFDAAISSVEGSFAALCPSDLRNCEVSTQSGKTMTFVIGAAGMVISSSLFVGTLVALLL